MFFKHILFYLISALTLFTVEGIGSLVYGVVPPTPTYLTKRGTEHLGKRGSDAMLEGVRCLENPACRQPMYFWDLFLEDVRSWECIDNGQRKTYYHGQDRFMIVNNSGQRRCFRKRAVMHNVQVLWEATAKDCEGAGVMAHEGGEPRVQFYLYGGATGV